MAREEQYSGIPREPYDFCDVCGRKIPTNQIGGKCVTCGRVACSSCVVAYGGRFYCRDHAPAPPQQASSGCFIATAAYGTPLAQEIQVLRCFRDRRLDRSGLGRRIVALYYETSPPIADAISQSRLRRKIVRMLLDPIVKVVRRLGYR